MGKRLEYTGTVDSDHPFEVSLRYCSWPLLSSDQWFLPRFRLRIKNLGRTVHRASLSVEITEFQNVKNLSQVGDYPGPFQAVKNHYISALLPGKEDKLTFRIESRFLQPGEYILRITFNEWIPSESPIRELTKQLQAVNTSEEKRAEARRVVEDLLRQQGLDPYAVPQGQYKGKQLFDLRFVERIKIHSLVSTATIMGVFIGSVLGTGGSFLYATVKILQENWKTIRTLFH